VSITMRDKEIHNLTADMIGVAHAEIGTGFVPDYYRSAAAPYIQVAVSYAQEVAEAALRESQHDLRVRLVRDQAVLMDRKVAAYHANDTTREAHLDGQITGLALALRYIAEEAAR
jgi:hypothetical protein